MFTRRQAIRWAELWLSCWNDGDFDTLLALHRDDVRFDDQAIAGDGSAPRIDRRDDMRRHWAAIACGIHAVPVELEHVVWDPDTRELAIVYVASFDGTRVHGCDLVTLDVDGRVLAGEPCVGSLVSKRSEHPVPPAYQSDLRLEAPAL